MTLGATLGSTFLSASDFLYPHLGQARIKVASLPVLAFFGSSREPHFGQNSIVRYSKRFGIPLAWYLLNFF